MYRGKGAGLVSCDLMRRLQHLHQEGVNGRVADELEKEEMLQTFEADGAQGRQAQQQLGKPSKMEGEEIKTIIIFITFMIICWLFSFSFPPAWLVGVLLLRVRLQRGVNLFPQPLHLLRVGKTFGI